MLGYIGLAAAYILIVSLLLWLFINSKANLILKILVVPMAMWYGIALYYTPSNLMGWPTPIDSAADLPPDAFVTAVQIKEPNKLTGDKGNIFITVIKAASDGGLNVKLSLNPKDAFTYNGNGEPRTFKLPYSKQLHKKILAAQKAQNAAKGSKIKTNKKTKGKKKKGTPGEDDSKDKATFRIVNPITLMPKDS